MIIAIIPLIVFFLRIQISYQGSDIVDHSPVFVGNFLFGIPYSLSRSLYEQIIWIFSTALNWGYYSFYSIIVYVFFLFSLSFLLIFSRFRIPMLVYGVVASITGYSLFFILSACSFYSYNSWDGALGCYNIIHQTRYVLFIVPLLIFTLSMGIISMYNMIKSYGHQIIAANFVSSLLIIFIFNLIWSLRNDKIKSYDREVTKVWLLKKDYKHKVVVQEYVTPTFMYYVQHSNYYPDFRDNIILTKQNMRIPKEIEPHLHELGVTNLSSFYYIGNKDAQGMKKGEGIQIIRDIFTQKGYTVKTLYEGVTTLLFISK